jgi:hypothetical protein
MKANAGKIRSISVRCIVAGSSFMFASLCSMGFIVPLMHSSETGGVISSRPTMGLDGFTTEFIPSDPVTPTTFKDISRSAGTGITRPTYGNPIWGDFDLDDNLDLLMINHGHPPALFRNDGDGSFADIRPTSGIARNGDRHGAAWGDYDNDGDLDLFITIGADQGKTVGSKTDQLYRNEGHGVFTDVTALAGVANSLGRGRSVNWVDFDKDGYLDLFVKNHQTPNVLYRNNGDGTFTDVAVAAGIADAPGDVSAWTDYDHDGDMDLFITAAAKDQLWRNNGDGTFTEVTTLAGLKEASDGEGVAWGDYNNDGYIDVYIARGYNDIEDSLVWDASHITFSDLESVQEDGLDFIALGDDVVFDLFLTGCHDPAHVFIGSRRLSPPSIPFVVSAAEASGQSDYTPGQDLGFFIWKDSDRWHIRWTSNGPTTYFYGRITSSGDVLTVVPFDFTRDTPLVTSTLYRNNGDGTFTDVTSAARVGSRQNNRGVAWGDYDNDGDLDLYVVNSGSIEGNKSNILYRNNGDGTFTIVTGEAKVWSSVQGQGRGDGAAWADFNNDGYLDLYVGNGWGRAVLAEAGNQSCLSFGPQVLYRNNGNGNAWLKVKLVGTTSNRDGIGARAVLQAGGLTLLREMTGGGGGHLYSQGNTPLHFGLGQAVLVDSLSIQWPSGIIQRVRRIQSNQSITIVEGRLPP